MRFKTFPKIEEVRPTDKWLKQSYAIFKYGLLIIADRVLLYRLSDWLAKHGYCVSHFFVEIDK